MAGSKKTSSKSYIVATGKSITSRIGILPDGAAVKPDYFLDGAVCIERLIKLGVVKEL